MEGPRNPMLGTYGGCREGKGFPCIHRDHGLFPLCDSTRKFLRIQSDFLFFAANDEAMYTSRMAYFHLLGRYTWVGKGANCLEIVLHFAT